MDAGTREVDKPSGRPEVPEWRIYGIARNTKNPLPEEPPPVSPLLTIVALILIFGICIGGMIMLIPGPVEKPSLPHQAITKPTTTTIPAPTTIATLQPVATTTPAVLSRPVHYSQNRRLGAGRLPGEFYRSDRRERDGPGSEQFG